MSDLVLHKSQVSILHALRYARSERFSALMRPTGQTGDTFKFHLRKLIKLGYVMKRTDGSYQLTVVGKEFAETLNEPQRTVEKQPKLSVLIVATQIDDQGVVRYLLQHRANHPFYGFWGEITGRVQWGESFEDAARRHLMHQTGLDASLGVRGFRRVRDYLDGGQLLGDKVFAVLQATDARGELLPDYNGRTNAWLTADELRTQEKVFASTLAIIADLEGFESYATWDFRYTPEDY